MRHALSFCLLLIASPALAQSIQMDLNPFGGRVTVTPPAEAVVPTARVEEVSGDGFHVTYRSSDTGYTQLEVVEPQGARATLWDGAQLVADDDVPTAATVRSGRWYRLVVTRHDGAVFERKLQSREGMRGTVRVFGFAAPAPAPVVASPPVPLR